MLDVEFAQLSDFGKSRDHNEDYLGYAAPETAEQARTHGWLFALADGVGGHDDGEVASRAAVEHLTKGFREAPKNEALGALLTRLLQEAVEHQAPKRAGAFRPKLRYAHQGGSKPPLIVIHGNSLEHVTDAYKRFLEGRFRAHFKLVGTPLRIEMRSGRNPFVEKGR